MQPFRYCAEWIFARPQDIIVERFIGWRRAGKRRLFAPFAIIRMGEYRIAVDGKGAVWNLIDAVQPKMPRAVVNQGMKGEFVHEQTFAQDLQDFITESDADVLVFRCGHAHIAEPNSTSMFHGYTLMDVKAQTKPQTILSAPKSWGQSICVFLPMRVYGAGVKWLPSLIVGDYPRLVFAQSLSESKSFDMETDVLISSAVLGLGGLADMRPHATVKRTEPAEIISVIAQTHHDLCDSDYEPPECVKEWSDDRMGMLFREVDDIEHMRAKQLFFSLS
jgi:hypothetical protein